MIALPVGFQKRMSDLLGDKAPAFFATYDRERSHALRVNTLKADPDRIRQLLPYLRDPVPWAPEGYYYEETEVDGTEHRPGKNPLHEAGCYYIQEASAMAVAALSGVQPGERVLDLCAAPGGKSTQLAAGMQGEGLLVSNEISPQRAKILSQNIERCGIINAIVTNMDTASLAEALPAYFDRVVVDAPCSGEGMFKKEQAALDMWSEDNIRLCHERQLEILENAAKLLRPGGTLVYSTCTFAPEEDEETLAAFLSAHQDFLMVDLPSILGEDFARYGFSTGRPDWCRLSVPETIRENLSRAVRLFPQNLRGEGHFVARLTRGEETPSRHLSLVRAKKENTKRRGKETGQESLVLAFTTFAKENLKEVPPQTGVFVPFGTELYRMPADLPLQGLRVLRPGLDLGSLAHDRFVPGHALALALKPEQAKRYLNLASDSREAAAYLHGEAIPCDPTLRGYVLVGFDGYSAGWGKAAGGICKNHYPKGLRRPY